MLEKLRAWFAVAESDEEVRTITSVILKPVLWIVTLGLSLSFIPVLRAAITPGVVLFAYGTGAATIIGTWLLMRQGHMKAASRVFVALTTIIIVIANLYGGGLRSPGFSGFMIVIVGSGLLLGRRGLVWVTVAAAVTVIALYLLERGGVLPAPYLREGSVNLLLLTTLAIYFILSLMLYVTIGTLVREREQSRLKEQSLQHALETLQATSVGRSYMDNILRSMSNLLLVTDAAGIIRTVNPTTLRVLGFKEDEIIGLALEALMHIPDDESTFDYSTLHKDVVFAGEIELRTAAGGGVPVSFIQSVLRDANGSTEGAVCVAQDITERKAAELERTRQAMRYRALFEQTSDAIFILNLKGVSIAVNQRGAAMLGYDSPDDLVGTPFVALSPEREHTRSEEKVRAVLAGENIASHERTMLRRDTTEIIAEIILELVRDVEGRPLHIQSVVRDITERKRVEQVMAYNARLLEHISDAVISTDLEGRISSWNNAAESVYGWKADEVMGKPLADVVRSEYVETSETFVRQQYIIRGYWRAEVKQHRRDGRELYVLSSVAVVRDQREAMIGLVTVNHDITTRKMTELNLQAYVRQLAALTQVNNELNSTLEVSRVARIGLEAAYMLSTADAGYILVRDPGGEDTTAGWHVAQTMGAYVEAEISAEDIGRAVTLMHSSIEPVLVIEGDTGVPADAAPVLPQMRARMILPMNSHGNLIALVNLEALDPAVFTKEVFDVLRLLAARIAVALDNADLYQVSQQQLSELRGLYERVKGLEEIKSEIIRIASHDLRGPIGVVKGFLMFLKLDAGERLLPAEHDYIAQIERLMQRMESISTDLLSLERVEQSLDAPIQDQMNLLAMVSAIVEDYEAQAAEKSQRLICEYGGAVANVVGDPLQIQQAASNLLQNAIKYTPAGGSITVRVMNEADAVRFEVQDTGIGIPPDAQARLFAPFYRVRTSQTSSIEGTGLGLYLVKRIVERHRGAMIFESELGKGSTFGFLLPGVPDGIPEH